MKALKIVLISFAALVILVIIAAVIVVNTVDINRFKPRIIEAAGAALNGRTLDFANARLRITLSGIGAQIEGITISEDPAFGTGSFLSIDRLSLGIDVIGYLLHRQIRVSSIRIDSPRISIVRSKEGIVNAQTLARPGAAPGGRPSPAAAAPALLISSVAVNNGAVRYTDNSFSPPVNLGVSNIEVDVASFSPSRPFPVRIAASVFSREQNMRVSCTVKLDPVNSSVTVSGLSASTDLSQLLPEEVLSALPMLKTVPLPQQLAGKVEVGAETVVAGASGPGEIDATVTLADGTVKMKEMAVPVRDIGMNALIRGKDAELEKFSALIGGGSVEVSGLIRDFPASQKFSLRLDARQLNLQEVIAQEQLPAGIEGIAAVSLDLSGEGFTPPALKQSLTGKADVSLEKARLVDINLLRLVLDKISVIPGLSQRIQAGLPERYKEKLTGKDTVLSDVKIPVSVENGRMAVRETTLEAEEFVFKGSGSAGFDSTFDLQGDFLIPSDLSAAMVSQVDELRYLLNGENRIFIPLKLVGSAGRRLNVVVDAEYIAKRLIVEQGKKELFRSLEKALGGSSSAPDKQESSSRPQQNQTHNTTPEEAVGGLLRDIFK